MTTDKPTLVTGGNGYLGSWLTATLLRNGTTVRATLRSPDREVHLREAVAPRRVEGICSRSSPRAWG